MSAPGYQYAHDSQQIVNYDPADGLQGREFGGRTVVKRMMAICAMVANTDSIFSPDSLRINNFIPPKILRRIKIFDEELKMDSSFTFENT